MACERCIDVRDIQVNGKKNVLPSGSTIVASYNWSTTSSTGRPRIIAPGAPRMYVSPGARTFSLGKDHGESFIDENGSRMHPFSSLEPLFHSLATCSPGFDVGSVDIVTDRNNLRKLLKFCGSPGERTSNYGPRNIRDEPFKFFVHAIGEDRKDGPTLVFTRVTTSHEVHYPGYGFNFERKLTKTEHHAPPDAGSFRVVVKMNLDGIALLVRSEVDACETVLKKKTSTSSARNAEDDLSSQLKGLLLSSGGESKVITSTSSVKEQSSPGREDSSTGSGLKSTKSGELLGADAQLLELKTKNGRHADEINWKDFYWQMALGGAHKLVLGLHNRGTFDGVQELPIKEVKARADGAGSSSMVYLANTLREVIQAARCVMAAPSSPSSSKSGKGPRAAVVVESLSTSSGGKGTLRVRLAVPGDGAVAP